MPLPESMVRKIFGESSAIGKELLAEEEIWSKERKSLVVGGVYKDFPENTQLNNAIYTSLSSTYCMDDWDNWIFLCYVLLDDPSQKISFAPSLTKHFLQAIREAPRGTDPFGEFMRYLLYE